MPLRAGCSSVCAALFLSLCARQVLDGACPQPGARESAVAPWYTGGTHRECRGYSASVHFALHCACDCVLHRCVEKAGPTGHILNLGHGVLLRDTGGQRGSLLCDSTVPVACPQQSGSCCVGTSRRLGPLRPESTGFDFDRAQQCSTVLVFLRVLRILPRSARICSLVHNAFHLPFSFLCRFLSSRMGKLPSVKTLRR